MRQPVGYLTAERVQLPIGDMLIACHYRHSVAACVQGVYDMLAYRIHSRYILKVTSNMNQRPC